MNIWPRRFEPTATQALNCSLQANVDGSGPSPRTRSRIQAKIKREAAKNAAEQERLRAEGQGIVRRASLNTPALFPDMEAAAAAVPEVTGAAAAEAAIQQRLQSSQRGTFKTKYGSSDQQGTATSFVPMFVLPSPTAHSSGERRRLHLQAANDGEAENVGGGPARNFSLDADAQPQPHRQRRRRGSSGSSGSAASNSTGRSQRISFATANE